MSLWLTVARRSLVVISHRMDVVLLGSDAYYGEIGLLFRSEANNPNETMGRQLSEPHIGAGRSLERESWVPELAFQTQSTARWRRPELAPGTGGQWRGGKTKKGGKCKESDFRPAEKEYKDICDEYKAIKSRIPYRDDTRVMSMHGHPSNHGRNGPK
ncbi:hypothetical protein FGSG_08787 [Fusarium graminearum PH-1]|uniref:Chromosome 2, complete genome n=1 Tax=Gibberella zeae (strain ATCC MYA-4620 / CBS 123657 / FGSC 9075 / NRRL 31084 / PH-1) TaxID=229533 RepID=I1RWV2_GIBZE|nr:hypothetical protein FGSG_08787 [Fusarium graminearum PH-1]ESU14511.1 hypothetical protein FGSG_08787 [Fusarium graminearum PH-1]CEF77211.1 unnamed protein product [Fusarium graminearum]|eukprot:XP_011319936.1 hypothetical protein FGSG_08787 [Fusarium graminearum PH-1]